jgi:hypothetical protein
MRRPLLAVLLALVVAATSVAGGTAAPAKRYHGGQVVRAFKNVGIELVDTAYGTLQPVTALATPRPRNGWSVAVYVYPTERGARDSYVGNMKAWRASGFAVTKLNNVVVTVVPVGAKLGAKKRKPLVMPALVTKALAGLPG